MQPEICFCGSGRPLRHCHGLRGKERRRRRIELEVLSELHDLCFLFPFVRPRDEFVDEFAWRLATEMSEPRDITPDEAAEGLGLLPDDERGRIVRCWAGRYPDVWPELCRKVGSAKLAEATLLTSAVRGAVSDRLGPRRELVAELECGLFKRSPAAAPPFVLEPETVWSFDEAHAGWPTVTRAHVARTRAQVRRLVAWLPIEGLEQASATLLRGCELVGDEGIARAMAELLFENTA